MPSSSENASTELDKINILSPDFSAAKLTKLQIRSLLGLHGIVELPPMSVKKDELIQMLETQVIEPALKKKAVKSSSSSNTGSTTKVKPSSHGITFLDGSGRVGSPNPPKSFASPVEESSPFAKKSRGRKKLLEAEENSQECDSFCDENPFQTPTRSSSSRSRSLSRKPEKESFESATKQQEKAKSAFKVESVKSKAKEITNVESVKSKAKGTPNVDSPKSKNKGTPNVDLRRTPSSITPLPFPEKIVLEPYVERQDRLLKFLSFACNFVRFLFRMLLLSSLACYLYIYFARPFPYCDSESGNDNRKISFGSFSDFYSSLSRYCLPCPADGKCSNGKLKCNDKFVEKRGFWIASRCVIDKGKLSVLEDMLATARKILNSRLGDSLCGSLPVGESESLTGSQIKLILAGFGGKTRRQWNSTPEAFDEFWRLFVEEVRKSASSYGIGYGEGKLWGMEASLSWKCKIRKLFGMIFKRYKMHFGVLLGLFFGYWRISRLLREKRQIARLSDLLIQQVFSKLQQQQQIHAQRQQQYSIQNAPTLSISQLRDTLMIGITSSSGRGESTLSAFGDSKAYASLTSFPLSQSAKKAIWDNVYRIVSANSNVREYVSTIRGEQHKVWEWIGIDDENLVGEMRQVHK